MSKRARRTLKRLDEGRRKRLGRVLNRMATLPDPRSEGDVCKIKRNGFWRRRVGSYRIVFRCEDEFEVVAIEDRKDVYG